MGEKEEPLDKAVRRRKMTSTPVSEGRATIIVRRIFPAPLLLLSVKIPIWIQVNYSKYKLYMARY